MGIFFVIPMALAYGAPFGPLISDNADEALFVVQIAALITSFAFVVVYVAMRLLATGPVARVADVDLETRFLAIAFGCLALWMAIDLVRGFGPVGLAYGVLVLAYLAYAARQRSRQQEYTVKRTFRSEPAAVFAFVTDTRNWPRYLPQIASIEPRDVALHLGSIFTVRVHYGKKLLEYDEAVIAFEPARRFGTAAVRQPFSDVYELADVAGGTEVAYTHHGEATVSRALLGDALRIVMARADARADGEARLDAIGRLVESPAPANV